jgi:hypothetical protein
MGSKQRIRHFDKPVQRIGDWKPPFDSKGRREFLFHKLSQARLLSGPGESMAVERPRTFGRYMVYP